MSSGTEKRELRLAGEQISEPVGLGSCDFVISRSGDFVIWNHPITKSQNREMIYVSRPQSLSLRSKCLKFDCKTSLMRSTF